MNYDFTTSKLLFVMGSSRLYRDNWARLQVRDDTSHSLKGDGSAIKKFTIRASNTTASVLQTWGFQTAASIR